MESMLVAPVGIGRQRQHPDGAAKTIVRATAAKERAVAAIVLDDKKSDQEPRRGRREEQRQPVAYPEAEPHRDPKRGKRHRCDRQLETRPPMIRLSVAC